MQFYITLYGCGINFFGGQGELSHKQFVKAPGLKTQKRVTEFACQTAKQYHHVMVNHHALTYMNMKDSLGYEDNDGSGLCDRIVMDGKYQIKISQDGVVTKNKIVLCSELLQMYTRDREVLQINGINEVITGYTRARYYDKDGVQSIYYAHPNYRGHPWYDRVFVHFVESGEEAYYPSLILGFVEASDGVEAVIQCAVRPMKWSTVEKNMFVEYTLGVTVESFVRVPLSSFVFTLCVIKDYGVRQTNTLLYYQREDGEVTLEKIFLTKLNLNYKIMLTGSTAVCRS